MAAAGHMNIELPARRTLLEEQISPFSQPTSMMTLPTGAPSAVMSKKTLTVAIVLRMGWIRVDSEDASVELLEGRGRVKPAERPRLAERWNSDPRGKSGAKAADTRAGLRTPGRSNIAGRGPRAGLHSYLGKLMQEKLFPLSNGSYTML